MNIPVANIIPSITNPRTTIDGPAMQELAESIRKELSAEKGGKK